MRVYEISYKEEFQQVVPQDDEVLSTDVLKFDASPKGAWVAPKVSILDPHLPRGDFYNFAVGALAFNRRTYEVLLTQFEMAGECFAFKVGEDDSFLLNVLECVNCLDAQTTEWVYGKSTGKPIRIKKYGFDATMFPESSIFKIPETRVSRIYTYEGVKDPEDEFKPSVEAAGFTGLEFTLRWESE